MVITIIVLLILVGVTLSTLTGQDGILNKAAKATDQTNKMTAEETVQVEVLGSYNSKGKLDVEDLNKHLINNLSGIKYKGNALTSENKISSLPAVVEYDGFSIVISETAVQASVKANEKVTKTEKYNYSDGVNVATVPAGFKVSEVKGEQKIENGLVIKDDDGNEFVWVPVPNKANFKVIEGYSSNLKQSYLTKCSEPYKDGYTTEQEEYDAMVASVEKYGGFYIGRYEAGKGDNDTVVVQKNKPVYNSIKWGSSMSDITGGAVEKAKEFKEGKEWKNSATSTLIYGIQWDATMQFFDSKYLEGNCDVGAYVRNSTEKGNYVDADGSNNPAYTGSDEVYAEKNIYDMAGNVYEWTMEAYNSNSRVRRGGGYGSDGDVRPSSTRLEADFLTANADFGFRIALYVV